MKELHERKDIKISSEYGCIVCNFKRDLLRLDSSKGEIEGSYKKIEKEAKW